MAPDVETLLREFLAREQEELSKARYDQLASALTRLTNTIAEHIEADRRWKADVKETIASHEARMNRHARRIAERESDRPPRRSPEDTLSEIDVRELREHRFWSQWRKQKLANILLSVGLMLLAAGIVAMIVDIAHHR